MTPAFPIVNVLRAAYESAVQEIRVRRPDLSRPVLDAELAALASVHAPSLMAWVAVAQACAQAGRPMPWESAGRLSASAATPAH